MNNLSARRIRFVKCLLVIVFAAFCGLIFMNQIFVGYLPQPVSAQTAKSPQKSDERFDALVRNDFFAGMFGDEARLERGMKFCEEILSKNPKHAEALVWHGGGLVARAANAYRKGDYKLGDRLWTRGIEEMNEAARLAPDHIGVLIGRSATLIGLAQAGWDSNDAESKALLESAVLDYEKVYQKQKSYFSDLSAHSRGELLFGLASGWSILGEHGKARDYLQLIVKKVKGSDYEREAQEWLNKKPTVIQHDCRGCHVSRSY